MHHGANTTWRSAEHDLKSRFRWRPSRDPDRARAFYRETLGLQPDPNAQYESWAGGTCFAVWAPEQLGMPFIAQKGNPWGYAPYG